MDFATSCMEAITARFFGVSANCTTRRIILKGAGLAGGSAEEGFLAAFSFCDRIAFLYMMS